MTHRILQYTQAGSLPGDDRNLSEQAAALLDLGLWGLPDKNQSRRSFRAGDEVVVYAGAPEKAFIGHATLASGFHRWTIEERSRYTGEFGELSSGLAFSAVRPWEEHLPLNEAWPAIGRPPPKSTWRKPPILSEEEYGALLAAAGQPRWLPEETWEEGAAAVRRHRAHERDPGARAEKKAQVQKANHGLLLCEACGTDGEVLYGPTAEAAFECHHRLPLAEGPRRTTAADLALLCASCHRVLHAMKPLPSVEQLRATLGPRQASAVGTSD